MDISSLSSLYNTSSTSSSSSSSSDSSQSVSKDDFLQLLVTQLKSQDPLNPEDSTEFTQQLATFSSLEQLFSINDSMKTLQMIDLSNTNSLTLTLIGKEVTANGGSVSVQSGSASSCSFDLGADAEKVTMQIKDSNGNVVRTIDMGKQASGSHDFKWDGKLDDGSTAKDGDYTMEITASDSSGNAINASTSIAGVVTSVKFEDGIAYAIVDGKKIPVSDITEVSGASVA